MTDLRSPSDASKETGSFGAVAPYYDYLMEAVPYRFWVQYIEQLWAKHGLSPRSVLDVACGTGTVSRLLAQRDLAVVGIDLSPGMIEIARRKAETGHLNIPFYQQDAADLDLGEHRFDAAISLFDSLNYILQPERLAAAFAQVYAHLTPQSSFLFDLNTEYALAAGMFNQSCSRRDEPLHYRWRSRYDQNTRLCTIRMNFRYDAGSGIRQEFVEVHRQYGYHKEEIIAWLQQAGFDEVAVYDAYSTEPPHKRSDRLFYLAVKRQEA